MKILASVLTLTVALFAWSFGSFAYMTSGVTSPDVVYGQEDCKDGETWNEEKQACEASAAE